MSDHLVVMMIVWFYMSRLACFWVAYRWELRAMPLPRATTRGCR